MKKLFTLATVLVATATQLIAQTATWSDDVASIVYTKCTGCHRQGGIGETSGLYFEDYNQVVSSKLAVQSSINSLRMPPWPPDANYKHFVGEKVLTATELTKINDFINNGTPLGNVANAPQLPVFSSADLLTNPSLTLSTPSYTVQATGDEYRTFVLPTGLSTTEYLNKVEFVPGNNQIVHHILIYLDTTVAHLGRAKDLQDAGEGFASNGTGQPAPDAVFIGGWAPGANYFSLPPNIGIQLYPNSDYLIEFHYAPNSIGQTDSTRINIGYCDNTASPRNAYSIPLLSHNNNQMVNGNFFIPANTVTHLKQYSTFKKLIPALPSFLSFSVFAIAPHMHKIGKSYKVYQTHNQDTTPYINIPRWDFNWQNSYMFPRPIKLAVTDTVWGEATYDNTTNNPTNPSNPPIDVYSGEHTTDEMMVTFLTVCLYQAGDENMNVDSLLNVVSVKNKPKTNNSKLLIFPTVANTSVNIQLINDQLNEGEVTLQLYDAQGKQCLKPMLMHCYKGYFYSTVDVQLLAQGTYTVIMKQGNATWNNKLVKQ
ncbi:MAG: hypothetical protein ABL940_09625 [Bacteroidia bacterium]